MSDQYNFNNSNNIVAGPNPTGYFFGDSRLAPVMEKYQSLVKVVSEEGNSQTSNLVVEIGNEIPDRAQRPSAIQKLTALTVAAGTGTAVAEAAKALIDTLQSLH